MTKKANNSEEVTTLNDNDEEKELEMMEENDYLEMKITEKEAQGIIMKKVTIHWIMRRR
jgi:hypothetical protein